MSASSRTSSSFDPAAPQDPWDAGLSPHPVQDQEMPWYARHRGTAVMLLVTAVVGMIATCILVAERLALSADPNYVTSCDLNPWVSCGAVMKSEQAMAFGFPNQFIGLVSFAVVITVAMGLLAGARYQRWFWRGLNLGVAAGFAFCVWLWYQAVYEITALCLYCMIVWAMMAPMLVLLTVRNLQHGVIPASPRLRQIAADWAWPVIALLYVAVIGSILLRFGLGIFQMG
ncbi:vitamin K epoxide reductase family protein [Micrococcus sp. IITD107]|uniref:vitamin K epoxide reductase family protein n=1 Tax=Micrococcus sp. IITD107 TaxID=3342790 RepID=UPI0035BB7D0A